MYGNAPIGAWQPSQRPRSASLGVAFACGGLAIPALVIMLISAHNAAVCQSTVGQLGQAISQTTAAQCATDVTVHTVALVALIVLGLGCVIATLTHLYAGRPAPTPGWPPPPPPPPPDRS
jgi:hypothetical protein